ncbi:MAG: tyrosine-type recombinase/integrase [bacterium]|nr:tyrosine-type recombinase/integrase [bacterium]MDE0418143.1 tyrosine-type recombinase/integrase [bacterium]
MRTTKRKARLTDAAVERLRPRKTEYTVWDASIAGLGVRVRPSGHRSYVWQDFRNGRPARITIGPVALKSIDEARRDCLTLMIEERSGGRKADAGVPLFSAFATGPWKEAVLDHCKPRWRERLARDLKTQLLPSFGSLRLDHIAPRHVEAWFDTYSQAAPGGANMTLQTLRRIMRFAVASGHIGSDPTRNVKRNRRPPLTRFLSRQEIARLYETLDRMVEKRPAYQPQADMIRLLLLTGCRRSEITRLRWCEVHGASLRLTDAKTGPREVWLSAAAQVLIERQPSAGSDWVFPSPRDPARPCGCEIGLWYRARREAGIEDVRLHDLRHTFASYAVMNGVPLPVVARLLGHSRLSMTLRYAHVQDKDVAAAAERTGKAIARLCAQ